MMFHLLRQDDTITGWMTCDNPSATPTAVIVKPDGTSFPFEANDYRQDLVDLNAHTTGVCGFTLNERTVPGFSEYIDLVEIREANSGVVVYRAPRSTDIDVKVFRFDMQTMPNVHVERCWHGAFRYYYSAVERHPYETLQFILKNYETRSIAISGRLNLQRYEFYLRQANYKFVTMLRDPYEEFAERLVFLHYLMSSDKYGAYSDYLTGLSGLASAVRRMDLSNLNSIAEAFSYLTDKQIDELTNPMTATLTCGVDQLPRREHVEIALAKLSQFDLVGVRPYFKRFKSALAEMLGIDILGSAEYTDIGEISALADELRNLKAIQSLLAIDARVYRLAVNAIESTSATHISSNLGHDEEPTGISDARAEHVR